MTQKQKIAAGELLTAVQALAWFIENVTDDDPDRTNRFFCARETWREAIALAEREGIKGTTTDARYPHRLITRNDASYQRSHTP